jgi:hypothetical protein
VSVQVNGELVHTNAYYYYGTWKHVYALLTETCFKHGKTFDIFTRVLQSAFKPCVNERISG